MFAAGIGVPGKDPDLPRRIAEAAAERAEWSQFAGTTFERPWSNGQGFDKCRLSENIGEVEDNYGNFLTAIGWRGKTLNEVISTALDAMKGDLGND